MSKIKRQMNTMHRSFERDRLPEFSRDNRKQTEKTKAQSLLEERIGYLSC